MMRVRDPKVFVATLAASGVGHNDLARKLDRSRGHLHDIKMGRKRLGEDDAAEIARLLGCSVEGLFETAPAPHRVHRAAQS